MKTSSIVERRSLVCLSCGARPGYLQDGCIRVANPEHAAVVARLRCPACLGGQLFRDDVESVLVLTPLPTDRCSCGNVAVAGETRYCATCAKRLRTPIARRAGGAS